MMPLCTTCAEGYVSRTKYVKIMTAKFARLCLGHHMDLDMLHCLKRKKEFTRCVKIFIPKMVCSVRFLPGRMDYSGTHEIKHFDTIRNEQMILHLKDKKVYEIELLGKHKPCQRE